MTERRRKGAVRTPLDPLIESARALDGSTTPEHHAAERQRFLERAARPDRSRLRPWLWAAAAAVLLAALATAAGMERSTPLSYRAEPEAALDSAYVDARTAEAALRFSDGSRFVLEQGSRARVASVDARGARLLLDSGRLRAHVEHRTDSAWQLEAGPYVVHVTGTTFDMAFRPGDTVLVVDLHEGSVRVEGPGLGSGLDLAGGQRLVADAARRRAHIEPVEADDEGARAAAEAPSAEAVEAIAMAEPATERVEAAVEAAEEPPPAQADRLAAEAPPRRRERTAPPTTPAPTPTTEPTSPAPDWRTLAARGAFDTILAEAEARGASRVLTEASADELAALADAARYRSRWDLAEAALQAQRTRFAGSPRARAAAFLIGRLRDDVHQDRAAAVEWYQRYLDEAPRGPLAAEAAGRRMVALSRLGRTAEAQRAAAAYLTSHPQGAHAEAARALAR